MKTTHHAIQKPFYCYIIDNFIRKQRATARRGAFHEGRRGEGRTNGNLGNPESFAWVFFVSLTLRFMPHNRARVHPYTL